MKKLHAEPIGIYQHRANEPQIQFERDYWMDEISRFNEKLFVTAIVHNMINVARMIYSEIMSGGIFLEMQI
jgi:hypothetical protein